MRRLLLALVLVFFSTHVFAQSFNFTNGSFETGDTNYWAITFPATFGTASLCGQPSTPYDVSGVVSDWASDGNKSYKLLVNSIGFNHCTQMVNTVNNDFNGNIRALVDYNSIVGGSNSNIRFYQKGVSRCQFNFSSGTIGTASCELDPSDTDFNAAFVVSSGSTSNQQNLRLDNFRWQHIPVIKTDTTPFTNDVFAGNNFSVSVDYNASGTCQVRDMDTNQLYSATHQGGGIFATSPLNFSTDANVSSIKTFNAFCDSIENDDPNWKVKINRDGLIAGDSSFETDCNSEGCSYTSGGLIGSDWNMVQIAGSGHVDVIQNAYTYNGAKVTNSGQYWGGVYTGSGAVAATTQLRSTTTLNGGVLYYDLISQLTGAPNNSPVYDVYYYPSSGGAPTQLYHLVLNVSNNAVGYDKNLTIPNFPGQIAFQISKNSSLTSDYYVILDDIRYVPKPQLVLDTLPFNQHIVSGENFTIDVNFIPGFDCTVKDKNTLITYATTYIGNKTYRTNNLQFTVPTNQISINKDFNVSCSTQTNDDPRWKVKINQYDLISSNGGFDNNSTLAITSSSTAALKDWEVNITGSGEVDINKNSTTNVKTYEGQQYARIKPGLSTTNVELKTKNVLFGGTVYFDSNYFNTGNTPSNNLKVIYYYQNGGSTTLFDSNSNIVGQDKNITIPNQYGRLAFSLGGANDNLSEFIFDNVRYQGENSSCKPIRLNGDSSEKIDVVFIGSGYPSISKLVSDATKLINYEGDSNGLMSFEPFKTYKSKFNFWYVDNNKTYSMIQSPITGNWRFNIFPIVDASTMCTQGDEFVLLSYYPRFRPYSFLAKDSFGSPTEDGLHWAFMTTGCEFSGDCSMPLDVKYSNPYDVNCQGDGNLFTSCNQPADRLSEIQLTFPHEFGHSFGGLLDEYQAVSTNAPFIINPANAPNCDLAPNPTKWSSFSDVNAQLICTYPNWYRPYPTETSLMEGQFSPRKEYRNVNVAELTKDILNYNTSNGTNFGPQEFLTYILSITVANGSFGVNSVQLVPGEPPSRNVIFDGNYSTKLMDANSNLVYDFNFYPTNDLSFENSSDWFDANGNQIVIPPNADENSPDYNIVIRAPYYPNVTKLDILDRNGTIKTIVDLSQFTNKISGIIGNGAGMDSNAIQNKKISYSIIGQPVTAQITSANYKASLGWTFYND